MVSRFPSASSLAFWLKHFRGLFARPVDRLPNTKVCRSEIEMPRTLAIVKSYVRCSIFIRHVTGRGGNNAIRFQRRIVLVLTLCSNSPGGFIDRSLADHGPLEGTREEVHVIGQGIDG